MAVTRQLHSNVSNKCSTISVLQLVSQQGDDVQVTPLLSVIGQPAVELYITFKWRDSAESMKLDRVVNQFKGHVNTTYERCVFNTRSQHEGEYFESFWTSLKSLARSCKFGEVKDSLIRDLITGVISSDSALRHGLLRKPSFSLARAVSIATNASITQAVQMHTTESTSVNNVQRKQHRSTSQQHKSQAQGISTQVVLLATVTIHVILNCGGHYPHSAHKPCSTHMVRSVHIVRGSTILQSIAGSNCVIRSKSMR